MGKLGFYFDMRACIGCRACQIACKDKNRRETAGVLYREVHTYEAGKYPDAGMFHLSMACNHCEEPACVAACPTGAMHCEEDGTVQSNEEVCIGCQTCAEACPYHAPKYLEDLGIIGKCDSCYTLRAAGQNPACVDACLMRCLDFGDLDELSKKYGEDWVNELPCLPEAETKPAFRIRPKEIGKKENPVKKAL